MRPDNEVDTLATAAPKRCPLRGRGPAGWAKRAGAAAFMLFLLKGLLWLLVPVMLALWRG